jgi:hypothetical protein
MQDVASSARKAAIQLVRTLIEFHPFGPALRGHGDERTKANHILKEVAERMKQLREEEIKAEAGAAGVEVDVDMDEGEKNDDEEAAQEVEAAPDGGDTKKLKRLGKKTVSRDSAQAEVEQCMFEAAESRERQREALKRMADCYIQRVRFVELIDGAAERLRALLMSKTASDVTESINVVVELRLRNLPAATDSFNQVLGLVWSRTAAVKDEAVQAFHRMHLDGRDARSMADGIIGMYQQGCASNWTYTHLASVQELMQQAAASDLIDPKVAIPAFVEALKTPSACPMALRALTALGAANWQVLAAQLPQIVAAVGPQGTSGGSTPKDRLERVCLLCRLIQRLQACCSTLFSDAAWGHLDALCEHCTNVVIEHFSKAHIPPEWFGAAQAAMDLCFDLNTMATAKSSSLLRCPDKLWEGILSRMLQGLLGHKALSQANANNPVSDALVPADHIPSAHEAKLSQPKVNSPQIGAIIFVSGHLALRMLIFLEHVQSALKKKRLAEEDARMADAREKKKEKKQQEQVQGGKKKKGSKGGAKEEEEEDEDAGGACGMAGQEEREAEFFAEIAEQRLLYGTRSLLDRVKPLIFSCLSNSSLTEEPILRRLAAISLCKFMTLSKRFCQENLKLLFSVLFPQASGSAGPSLFSAGDGEGDATAPEKGMGALLEDLTLRQSLLVSVGDLLFRHPNVVEPWSGRLYAALGGGSDRSVETSASQELRLTALLVLTHLVLNDMLKPRTVLLTRSLWLTASAHEATARVARILFQELAKRTSNVIYNLLPEIIARVPEFHSKAGKVTGGPEDRVRFLMQFIEKEKQVEGLIEKLSVRLEQCAEIASGLESTSKRGSGREMATQPAMEGDEDGEVDPGAKVTPARALATVSCLGAALGSMNYSDRCIMRLHDVVVTRKALNNSIAYHKVARDNLMQIVEKARNARKKEKGDKGDKGAAEAAAAAPADKPDAATGDGAGGKSAAAVGALDAIEQVLNKVGGKEEEAAPAEAVEEQRGAAAPGAAGSSEGAAPADAGGKRGRPGKRDREQQAAEPEAKASAAAEEGGDAEPAKKALRKAKKQGGKQDQENAAAEDHAAPEGKPEAKSPKRTEKKQVLKPASGENQKGAAAGSATSGAALRAALNDPNAGKLKKRKAA